MKTALKPIKISEILEPISRAVPVDPLKEYPLLGIRLDGGGVFHRETKLGSQIAATTLFQVKMGDFIYSRLFAWRGAFGTIGRDLDSYYVSGEFPTFIPVQDKIDIEFLQYWFRLPTTISKIEADCTGSTPLTRNRFKENFFLALEIPLPPLEEQRRIVARIEELAAKIEEAKGLRQRSVEEAEMLLNNQLATIFDSLVKRYSLRALSDLLFDAGYGTSVKCITERTEGSVQVLRIPNVVSEQINFHNMKYGVLSSTELERVLVKEGDILVVRTNGSADLVGRSAVIPALSEPTAFASYLIRIQCDRSVIASDYLQVMLRHLRTNGQLIDFARTTAGQYNVSLGRLRTAMLPVPPLHEQHRIVTYLENLQGKVGPLKQLQAETSAELNALLPSILDKAFKGEL